VNLIDVNLLLYAYDERSALHEIAKKWLTGEFRSPEPTGLTLPVILGFVRIATNSRVFAQPMTISEACAIVDSWLALPSVYVLAPTDRHWPVFVRCAVSAQSTGPLVPDADLAAYAFEHGATLCTHDRDFARFEGLRLSYPLSKDIDT